MMNLIVADVKNDHVVFLRNDKWNRCQISVGERDLLCPLPQRRRESPAHFCGILRKFNDQALVNISTVSILRPLYNI